MRKQPARFLERFPLAIDRPLIAYGCTLLLIAVSLMLRFVAEGVLPIGFPYVTFFPSVLLAAFLFGLRPGVLAAVLCGILAWYFFIPPARSFGFDGGTAIALGFYTMVVGVDIAVIHWMQRANAWLAEERSRSRQLAERNELLLREVQHRVSNNLQVVAALLTLQRRDIADPQAHAAIDEAARRLALIGRIHRQLYDPSGGRQATGLFLEQLATDLMDAGGKPGITCTVDAAADIVLDPDAAIPLALIVAEAVANALEHGFADRTEGRIAIVLRRAADNRIELRVQDDGSGLRPGFDADQTRSLGLRIATTLAKQLGGRFDIFGEGSGTIAQLTLPV